MDYCKVNLSGRFFIWVYFHIFPIVFFKHYYCSTTANSSRIAGRLQGHGAQITGTQGAQGRHVSRLDVFVQVCTQAAT